MSYYQNLGLQYLPDDIITFRVNMERERAKLLTADTHYKLKDQP